MISLLEVQLATEHRSCSEEVGNAKQEHVVATGKEQNRCKESPETVSSLRESGGRTAKDIHLICHFQRELCRESGRR